MCGVFGVFNHPQAARLTYLGLYALQHRGQESSGIVASNSTKLVRYCGMGLVNQVYKHPDAFEKLTGNFAIGHNRYSTTGSSNLVNTQPFLIDFKGGQIAAAHNGNLVNASEIRKEMENEGSIFTSTTDTEVIMHCIAKSRHDSIEAKIMDALSQVKGSFSIVFLTKDGMYAAQDYYGNRPLSIGTLGDSFIVSSETCAFDLLGATLLREVKPGELVRISKHGLHSFSIPLFETSIKTAHCIFEYIYFARPDSLIFGENVDKIRRELGRQLAREYPNTQADIVIGVPDSSTTAAIGYSEESGIRFDIGLIRNHYVGRTFILPEQAGRDISALVKFNPVKGVIKNKSVVVVDDSIVRATTMKKIISVLRNGNPSHIHLRISSPPIISPCFYGIDMPEKKHLIAADKTVEEIRDFLGVDSLGYLSRDGMVGTAGKSGKNFCSACFDGMYPIV